ncbi:MAG: hypothetical protein QXI12_06700 [Candidatus Methanomethyliaceae archaeon]
MSIVLFPYSNAYSRVEESRELCKTICRKLGLRLVEKECVEGNDYETFIKSWWNHPEDILIWEHDMYPSARMVKSLLRCYHGICVQQYVIKDANDKRVFAHRVRELSLMSNDSGYTLERWADDSDQWVELWGFGLTKISYEARTLVPWDRWEPGVWHNLDSRVSEAFYWAGFRAHVHKPVCRHDHKKVGIRSRKSIDIPCNA